MVERGLHVAGVDSSPTMISFCRDRLPDQEWIVADMRQLALGRPFDGIVAWDSFFHLDYDAQRRMFAVFANHSAVDTVLMFNTGPQHGEVVGDYKGDPLYHASLSSAEYEALLARFGFRVILHTLQMMRRPEDAPYGCVKSNECGDVRKMVVSSLAGRLAGRLKFLCCASLSARSCRI
jgi:hypothetical protein